MLGSSNGAIRARGARNFPKSLDLFRSVIEPGEAVVNVRGNHGVVKNKV